jgi:hypothetical protein
MLPRPIDMVLAGNLILSPCRHLGSLQLLLGFLFRVGILLFLDNWQHRREIILASRLGRLKSCRCNERRGCCRNHETGGSEVHNCCSIHNDFKACHRFVAISAWRCFDMKSSRRSQLRRTPSDHPGSRGSTVPPARPAYLSGWVVLIHGNPEIGPKKTRARWIVVAAPTFIRISRPQPPSRMPKRTAAAVPSGTDGPASPCSPRRSYIWLSPGGLRRMGRPEPRYACRNFVGQSRNLASPTGFEPVLPT